MGQQNSIMFTGINVNIHHDDDDDDNHHHRRYCLFHFNKSI